MRALLLLAILALIYALIQGYVIHPTRDQRPPALTVPYPQDTSNIGSTS